VRLLLISGSTRRRSINTAALHTARDLLGGDSAMVYDNLEQLPAYTPDARATLPSSVACLRDAIAEADAVVFCTPEYGGRLPESLRTLLDWTGGAALMRGKPATWLNVAGVSGGDASDTALRATLRSVGASVMTSSGIRVPVSHDDIGPDGLIADLHTLTRLRQALGTIAAELAAASRTRIPVAWMPVSSLAAGAATGT
jgi:NAD(P)H-dependent FMN reductase